MPNSSQEIIETLKVNFKRKSFIYGVCFVVLNLFLIMTGFILSLVAALASKKIIDSPSNYALISIILTSLTSFFGSLLAFFIVKKRFYLNKALYKFILLEEILLKNKLDIYANQKDPELTMLNRIYAKIGVNLN